MHLRRRYGHLNGREQRLPHAVIFRESPDSGLVGVNRARHSQFQFRRFNSPCCAPRTAEHRSSTGVGVHRDRL